MKPQYSFKKTKPEFQFSTEKMLDFLDKKIKIKYDGKIFEGVVDNVYFDDSDNSDNNGLIIKGTNGEWKHIKLYRLEKLEVL